MYDAAYGNGVFVAGGNKIVSSVDGETWTDATTPPGFSYLASVEYGGGLFVGVGWQGNLFTSSDGINWTNRNPGVSSILYDVAYGDNLYVAVGQSGTILTSPDGVTWTTQNSNTYYDLNRITYGNGKYVAVGNSGVIFTSTDGIAWTSNVSGTTNQLYAVAYGNGLFVAGGQNKIILTSPDGAIWTERQNSPPSGWPPISDYYRRALFNDGVFVLAGSSGLIDSSTDGIHWSSHSSGTSIGFWGLTAGNGTYMATGDQGSILQTIMLVNAEAPSIGTQPADETLSVGDTSPTLSVAATVGDGGTLSYQWYSNATNSNSGGTVIVGATSATYAAPTASEGTTYYYAVVTNSNSGVNGTQTATATSAAAKVTVNALVNAEAPSIGTQPADETVSVGDTSPTLSVAATVGDGGTLSYQWYSNATNSNSGGTVIVGATSATYAAPTASEGTTYYYVVVTNTNSGVNGTQTATATSAAAKVTVNALVNAEAPSIGTQPADETVSVGDTSPTLSVAATVGDGGTLSYQWYNSATNSNSGGTVIVGATSATYAAPTASEGTTYYYVVVTNTNSGVNGTQTATATSAAAKVTVNALVNAEAPSIGTQAGGRDRERRRYEPDAERGGDGGRRRHAELPMV
ncbi:WD40/YVTN/BNR-like repeat-containing protein [Cohnella rhizosphaerae]|uniref:Ig-like domain-containing protein n=1 Tax=Cohnella rhizosphaerae TaxID=1457232 RepID=A0A9X4KV52_9BACL|nr:hypothetical protein [Cohnella rhizosphaerae]MDG0811293.1 hypothetical protein [Cohnella rhizosphaerae]